MGCPRPAVLSISVVFMAHNMCDTCIASRGSMRFLFDCVVLTERQSGGSVADREANLFIVSLGFLAQGFLASPLSCTTRSISIDQRIPGVSSL